MPWKIKTDIRRSAQPKFWPLEYTFLHVYIPDNYTSPTTKMALYSSAVPTHRKNNKEKRQGHVTLQVPVSNLFLPNFKYSTH